MRRELLPHTRIFNDQAMHLYYFHVQPTSVVTPEIAGMGFLCLGQDAILAGIPLAGTGFRNPALSARAWMDPTMPGNRLVSPALPTLMALLEMLSFGVAWIALLDWKSLHFLPQIDRAGETVGDELLLHWIHPDFKSLSPASFVSVADKSGPILSLESGVLRQLFLLTKILRMLGFIFLVPVNVSRRQFLDAQFVHPVTAVLAETGAGELAIFLNDAQCESGRAKPIDDWFSHHVRAPPGSLS